MYTLIYYSIYIINAITESQGQGPTVAARGCL